MNQIVSCKLVKICSGIGIDQYSRSIKVTIDNLTNNLTEDSLSNLKKNFKLYEDKGKKYELIDLSFKYDNYMDISENPYTLTLYYKILPKVDLHLSEPASKLELLTALAVTASPDWNKMTDSQLTSLIDNCRRLAISIIDKLNQNEGKN